MAYKRGLLTQADYNEVQERLLLNIMVQERVDEHKKSEEELEKLIMIHRPEVWQKMQEEKQEAQEMGFDQIVWKSPESIEEFYEIEKALGQFEQEVDTEIILEAPASHFNGIDLSELED